MRAALSRDIVPEAIWGAKMSDLATRQKDEPETQVFTVIIETTGVVPASTLAAILIAFENAARQPDAWGPDARVELIELHQGSIFKKFKVWPVIRDTASVVTLSVWLGFVPPQLASFDEIRDAVQSGLVSAMTIEQDGQRESIDLANVLNLHPVRYGSAANYSRSEQPRISWSYPQSPTGPAAAPRSPPSPPGDKMELTGTLARSPDGELRLFAQDAKLYAAEFASEKAEKMAIYGTQVFFSGKLIPRDYLALFRIEEVGRKPYYE